LPVSYDNEYIKAPGMEVEYTPEMITHLKNSINDINHFCQFVKILHPDHGRIQFIPRDYQTKLFNLCVNNRKIIGLFPRQAGKTTTVGVFVLWKTLFNNDYHVGIVSNKANSAKDFLDRIRLMYEELPIWIKPGVLTYAKTHIEFENGSRIMVSATSESAFRGRTLSCLLCDELGFVPRNQSEAFWASNYPTISASKTSKIIVISTPNGMFNLFHRLWIGAESKTNGFEHLKITWRDVPGRDDTWAEEEKKVLGENQFLQEEEVQFLGSSSTLIDTTMLETLLASYKPPILYDLNNSFYIYEKPINKVQYVLGVDTGKGIGGDYSVIQVFKLINSNPINMEQVAVYRSNIIDSYSFAEIVNRVSIYYNNAYIMCENNDEGSVVVNQLWWEYENMNLINYEPKRKTKAKNELGIRATKSTKPKGALLMKKLIENNNIKLKDQNTIEELAGFIEEKGKYFGKDVHDDTVMALIWACFIFETKILTDEFKIGKNYPSPNKEEGWGILADYETIETDWSWLNS